MMSKRLRRFIGLAFVLVSLTASAQESGTNTGDGAKNKSNLRYLRHFDRTLVSFKGIELIEEGLGPGPESITLIVEVGYLIRPAVVPETVTINIVAGSLNGFQFDGGQEFVLTLDGEQLPLGDMTVDLHRENKKTGTMPANYDEALILTIPFEAFDRLLKAKKVKLRIGSKKVDLRSSVLKTLRENLAAIDEAQLIR